jgi:purine-cytosine permease-like protein
MELAASNFLIMAFAILFYQFYLNKRPFSNEARWRDFFKRLVAMTGRYYLCAALLVGLSRGIILGLDTETLVYKSVVIYLVFFMILSVRFLKLQWHNRRSSITD